MKKSMKQLTILSVLTIMVIALSSGSALAWTVARGTHCVAGSYGTAAVSGATDQLEVIYCNIFNGITGAIGATLAICMIIFGVYTGAFGKGGVMGAIPFVIMGLVLGLSQDIVGWLGVTVNYVPLLRI